MRGWVYVVSNAAMPDIVKIGYTLKDPIFRAKNFYNTNNPCKFMVEYDILVDSPKNLEKKIHKILLNNKYGKEWYKCSIKHAITIIRCEVGTSYLSENFYSNGKCENEVVDEEKIQLKSKLIDDNFNKEEQRRKDFAFKIKRERKIKFEKCEAERKLVCEKYKKLEEFENCKDQDFMNIIVGLFREKDYSEYHRINRERDSELKKIDEKYDDVINMRKVCGTAVLLDGGELYDNFHDFERALLDKQKKGCADARAQFNMIFSYLFGEHVSQNFAEAYFWAILSSLNGYSYATPLREEIKEYLSHSEIMAVEKKIRSLLL